MPRELLTVTGRVESVGDGLTALAIDTQRCASCVGCFWRGSDIAKRVSVAGACAVKPGQPVNVRLPVSVAATGALILYGSPLGGVLVGAALGASVTEHGDLGAVIGAIFGLAAAVFAMRCVRGRLEREVRERLSVSVR